MEFKKSWYFNPKTKGYLSNLRMTKELFLFRKYTSKADDIAIASDVTEDKFTGCDKEEERD